MSAVRERGGTGARGLTLLEVAVGAAILALVLGLAVPGYTRFLARRDLTNAAFLVLNDLRLAHETAAAQSGEGPRAEVCFRTDGYEIFKVLFESDINRTGAVKGPVVKVANAGQDYSAAVTMSPTRGVACLPAEGAKGEEGTAVGFLGSGAPYPGPEGGTIVLTHSSGLTAFVDIAPDTGLATVRR